MKKYLKKKILLYAVLNASITSDNFSEDNILSYAPTLKDANEYVSRRVFYDCKEHYIIWCQFRNLDDRDENSWRQYYATLSDEEKGKYYIAKLKYSIDDIALLFRLFNECIPVGASYEKPIEIQNYNFKLAHEKIDEDKEDENDDDDLFGFGSRDNRKYEA